MPYERKKVTKPEGGKKSGSKVEYKNLVKNDPIEFGEKRNFFQTKKVHWSDDEGRSGVFVSLARGYYNEEGETIYNKSLSIPLPEKEEDLEKMLKVAGQLLDELTELLGFEVA